MRRFENLRRSCLWLLALLALAWHSRPAGALQPRPTLEIVEVRGLLSVRVLERGVRAVTVERRIFSPNGALVRTFPTQRRVVTDPATASAGATEWAVGPGLADAGSLRPGLYVDVTEACPSTDCGAPRGPGRRPQSAARLGFLRVSAGRTTALTREEYEALVEEHETLVDSAGRVRDAIRGRSVPRAAEEKVVEGAALPIATGVSPSTDPREVEEETEPR